MNTEYRTTDIVLAASLCVHDYKMVSIEISGSRGTFVFENVNNEFLLKFELGECLVNPVDFNHQIKRLTTSVRRISSNR
jgi:hypothetical protein